LNPKTNLALLSVLARRIRQERLFILPLKDEFSYCEYTLIIPHLPDSNRSFQIFAYDFFIIKCRIYRNKSIFSLYSVSDNDIVIDETFLCKNICFMIMKSEMTHLYFNAMSQPTKIINKKGKMTNIYKRTADGMAP
jgi:hypothetical protein